MRRTIGHGISWAYVMGDINVFKLLRFSNVFGFKIIQTLSGLLFWLHLFLAKLNQAIRFRREIISIGEVSGRNRDDSFY